MPYKFWNIREANTEIERLEKELKDSKAANESLAGNTPEIEAEAKRISEELTAATAKVAQAESDLATAKQTISTLTGEREAISAQLVEANKKLANPGEQIKNAASAQAAAVLAASGHTPIAAAPEVKTDAGAKEREAISKLTGIERAIAAHKLKTTTTTK